MLTSTSIVTIDIVKAFGRMWHGVILKDCPSYGRTDSPLRPYKKKYIFFLLVPYITFIFFFQKQLQEGLRLSQALQAQIETLQRAKKAYDKAFKEAEKAIEGFHKADADLNLSRAEVEKQRSNMSHKTQACDMAKNEYAQQLQRTNDLQRQHFR